MAKNRGKDFEAVVKECFLRVPGVSIDRLHDQTNGFKGGSNICDFIVYKKPYEYYVECKTIHGNTFPLVNITDKQWKGLFAKSKIMGVKAGVLCWWVDKDVTKWLPIKTLGIIQENGFKSVRYDMNSLPCYNLIGEKKRIYFDYDMEAFFNEV